MLILKFLNVPFQRKIVNKFQVKVYLKTNNFGFDEYITNFLYTVYNKKNYF